MEKSFAYRRWSSRPEVEHPDIGDAALPINPYQQAAGGPQDRGLAPALPRELPCLTPLTPPIIVKESAFAYSQTRPASGIIAVRSTPDPPVKKGRDGW